MEDGLGRYEVLAEDFMVGLGTRREDKEEHCR